jgi:hypothetical protein
MNGNMAITGNLQARVIRANGPGLFWHLTNWMKWSMIKSLIGVFIINPIARAFGLLTAYGKLEATLFKRDGSIIRYGVISYRVVTTAFANFVVAQLQTETSVFGDFKYHDAGVGTTAADVGDTAIETTDGQDRSTGTQAEGAAANIYSSVGTITYAGNTAVTEHGLFNAATEGTLLDRHVFSAINVVSGDSIQFTYALTVSAGG